MAIKKGGMRSNSLLKLSFLLDTSSAERGSCLLKENFEWKPSEKSFNSVIVY